MKNHSIRTLLALMVTFCLLLGSVSFATAEQANPADAAADPAAAPATLPVPQAKTSDFEALLPFMDLVGSAAMTAGDEPEVIGNEETSLSPGFISAFFNNGLTADATLGITPDVLADTAKQAAFLTNTFAAQQPTLEVIAQTLPISGYIGFQPVTVNVVDEGDVQIIGELYWGTKAMRAMSEADYRDIQWLDRAIYTFREDAKAANGYLLTGFSVGSELNMEDAMQTYTENILVEYINTTLGFSILYPSVFTDDELVEDENGVSATLPDGSLSFFVRRAPNTDNTNLADYINVIANGIQGAKAVLHEEFNSASITFDTEDGNTVFDVYIVTDKYVYQAELSYRKDLASTYNMYTSYLENSFAVDAVSVG